MSMSSIAASQNHSRSPSARARSSLKVAMPCRSMNFLSLLFAITSGLGSQITSPITTGCIVLDSKVAVERRRSGEGQGLGEVRRDGARRLHQLRVELRDIGGHGRQLASI